MMKMMRMAYILRYVYRTPKFSINGRPTSGAAAPPRFQLSTGQYECGNTSSLMWKLSLICSAALVIIVPLTWTIKVIEHARIHARYFFATGQLKGFSGSFGTKSTVLFVAVVASLSPVETPFSCIGSCASSSDCPLEDGDVDRVVCATDADSSISWSNMFGS